MFSRQIQPSAAPAASFNSWAGRVPNRMVTVLGLGLGLMALVACQDHGPTRTRTARGVTYYNEHLGSGPWSVHIVEIDRQDAGLQLHSAMGRGNRLGLRPLSEQAASIPPAWGKPVAAVNGDFYAREGTAYPGDPRGLQIVDGELVSGPGDQAAFWLDAAGAPHATNVISQFRLAWPDGTSFPFGLNEECTASQMVLCTAALGDKTRHRTASLELILEAMPDSPWLPLRIGETYRAKVRSVRQETGTPLTPDTVVLSIGNALAGQLPPTPVGTVLSFSTETSPGLKGARIAIGGGSILVRHGKLTRLERPASARGLTSYSISSMFEQHPRSVLGWNETHFFLGEVDGRQRRLSVGMTLE